MSDFGHLPSLVWTRFPHRIHRGRDSFFCIAVRLKLGWMEHLAAAPSFSCLMLRFPYHSSLPPGPPHLPPAGCPSLVPALVPPRRGSHSQHRTCAAGPAGLAGPGIGRASGGGRSRAAPGAAPWAPRPQPPQARAGQGAWGGGGRRQQQQQRPEQQEHSREVARHGGLRTPAGVVVKGSLAPAAKGLSPAPRRPI